jgi:nucleotide-binding universal stress UspA family protein
MPRLLVPLDGSPPSLRALDHAIALAEALKGAGPNHIHVICVHEMPHDYGRSAAYFTAEQIAQMEEQFSAAVLQPAIEKLKTSGIAFSSESAGGEVAHAIADSAEREGCDAIVMGTRGMGSIGSLMLGSVATKVVHLTKLPVTLVK